MFIPLDEAFPTHRKTLRFCGLMQDHNAFAYLIRLWTWAARSAPDGELTGLAPSDIEMAIQYRQADGRCYAAMVAAGFIEEDEPGYPARIHNWMERTGASIRRMEEQAKAARDRKSKWRERRAGDADATDGNGHGTHESRVTSAGQDAVERAGNAHRQDKDRTDQARQDKKDPDLSLSSPRRSPDLDPAGARSNPSAVSTPWTGYQWRERFGRAWCEKYKRLAYGSGGDADARATGDLSDQLAALPKPERAAAERRAIEMFAEFLGDESPAVVKARHPWSWFVTRFPGLRVPKADVPKAPEKVIESFAERDARLKREQRERERAETERQVAAANAKAAEVRAWMEMK